MRRDGSSQGESWRKSLARFSSIRGLPVSSVSSYVRLGPVSGVGSCVRLGPVSAVLAESVRTVPASHVYA